MVASIFHNRKAELMEFEKAICEQKVIFLKKKEATCLADYAWDGAWRLRLF